MKKVPLIVFLSILLVSCRSKEVVTDSTSFSPVDYVNPLVGTQSLIPQHYYKIFFLST